MSAAKRQKTDAVPAEDGAAPAQFSDKDSVQELLPLFYDRLFPASDMYRWLAYGHDSATPHADQTFFQRREFCFTLENDIFVRYQSFKDGAELRAAICKRKPAKIDIGPVFNVDPQKRAAYSALGADRVFAPVERELVFDVDLTDYDDVRTCCSGGAVCHMCWPFMTVAVAVVNASLREDFGFQHLLWVYSGRRGVHCWVCDSKARQLTNEQRSAVAEYFSVSKGVDGGKKLRLSFPLHPSLQRAHDTVLREQWLQSIAPEHRLLEEAEKVDALLSHVPDEDVRAVLGERLKSGKRVGVAGGEEVPARWALVEREVERAARQCNCPADAAQLRQCLVEIVFLYTFPRLDIEVSKHMNHLLKAPFCVHPKTGRVCVPIDPQLAHAFDPLAAPTVAQLLNELNQAAGSAMVTEEDDFEKTSMRDAIGTFRTAFLEPLLVESRRELADKAREKASQAHADW